MHGPQQVDGLRDREGMDGARARGGDRAGRLRKRLQAHHAAAEHQRGRYGCWEQYCSDVAVLASASALRGEPVRSMDEFVDLVRLQDPAAKEALDRFLTHLAIGLTNIISIFDTQLIAINARLLNEFPSYLPEVQRRMTLPITQSETVVLARTGGRGAVLGAADAAVDRFFEGLSVGEGEPERP